MLKSIFRFILTICLTASAYPGTISGNLQTPSGGAVVGGTLTFTLSQAAIVSGTASVVPSAVSCYTSTSGAIVGLPDPTALPVITANLGSGTVASGTYQVQITYYNASGETMPSPISLFTLTATGSLIVNGPLAQPTNATGYNVYIASVGGTLRLQSSVVGFTNFTLTTPPGPFAVAPSSNTSTCSIKFSDELIPSGTSYAVNLLNKSGAQMSGYPQSWYTFGGSGGTINVSAGTPQGGGAVIYPTAIIANPAGNAQQSISGPLSLGSYTLTAGNFAYSSANVSPTPFDYSAKGDAVKLTTCSITSGQSSLVCTGATFSTLDVGKAIVVHGAGAAGVDLVTTILGFTANTTVTLNTSASTTSTNVLAYYGTDDTAAIKSCIANGTALGGKCTLNNGKTFMMSNTASTIVMNGTGVGGILDGTGTIVFAPTGALTSGVNDRFLYIRSAEATPIQIAAGAIAKGATSFTANAAGDVSTWVKGDWIVVTEKDAALGDVLYVDWMQVSSVAGTTVNVITPFRMAFPNVRAWNVSGTPAACTAAGPCGLSARKITNITNATLRDFHLIVPNISSAMAGIVTRDTRGVVMDNLTIDAASGNAIATYLDQGLRLNNVHWDTAVGAEIAGTVDFSISGLQSQQVGTTLNSFIAPAATCVTIDLGSGFGTLSNSTCGPNSNVGIFLNGGVHDTTVTSNTVGWIKGSSLGGAIQCVACYRVVLSGNVLAGGDGSAVGVLFSDSGAYTVTVNSDSNQAIGNVVNGFPTNISCAGANSTDNCDDYSATSTGLRTIRNPQVVGLVLSEGGTALVNGANNNVVPSSANGSSVVVVYASGPTGVFSVSGFTGGKDGKQLILYNSAAFAMTITNEGGGSTAANRIKTLTGADVVLRAGTSIATFLYLAADSRWILQSTN